MKLHFIYAQTLYIEQHVMLNNLLIADESKIHLIHLYIQ